jgi:hypothetical protein
MVGHHSLFGMILDATGPRRAQAGHEYRPAAFQDVSLMFTVAILKGIASDTPVFNPTLDLSAGHSREQTI